MNIGELTLNLGNMYVAHHNTSSLDEIQRMAVSYLNKHPIALEGSPGSGKNHAISTLASAIKKKEYRIRCTEEMMARDIIGGEKLDVEKSVGGKSVATKTVFYEGKMMSAMKNGQILILDEFNQLLPTVQKAFNSTLEEYRTIDSLEGGNDLFAKNNFGLFITYNPDTGVAKSDIEPAVKNRCKFIHFKDLSSQLKAYIALMKTNAISIEDVLDLDDMQVRGLHFSKGKLDFLRYDNSSWINPRGEHFDAASSIHPYLFFDYSRSTEMQFSDSKKQKLYRMTKTLVNIFEDVERLRTEGTVPFLDAFRDYDLHSVSRLNITPSSSRIVNKLVDDYRLLKTMGVAGQHIASDLMLSIMDFSLPAGERNEKIGTNLSVEGLVQEICVRRGLLTFESADNIRRATLQAARQGAINSFMQQDYTESEAEDLVDEYVFPKLKLSASSKKDVAFDRSRFDNPDDDDTLPF